MADKLEKWQEALGYWDEWNSSIEQAQLYIRNKYGDINKLISEAIVTISQPYDVNNPEALPAISWNEAEDTLTETSDEVQRMASAFITGKIGIYPGSMQEYIFQMFWISQAFPELMYRFEIPQENLEEAHWHTPWYDPQIKLINGEKVIIDCVCWYRKETGQQQIIQLLPRIWQLNDDVLRRRLSGGPRPKPKDDKEYPEAIVCYILKNYGGKSVDEIASLLDYLVYEDKDKHGKPMNTTIIKRLRQAKQLLSPKITAPN